MEEPEAGAVSGETESASMNCFERLAGVYFEPTKTFRDINIKPSWIGIFLISAILGMLFTYVITLRIDTAAPARRALESSPIRLSEEQLRQFEERAAAQQNSPFSRIMSLVTTPVWSIILYLIMTGIFLLVFYLMGAQLKFKKSLAVTIWGFAPPMIIQQILSIIILYLKEPYSVENPQEIVMSNLGAVVDGKAHPVLASVASSMDLFSLWVIVLLSIGFAAVSDKKLTPKKAAAGVVILWLLYVFGKAGVGAVFPGIPG